MEDPAENLLGDFRILREIGCGGMGIVYEAQQISLNRRVAVKVLPRAAAFDEQRLERFRNEVRAAAALAHPNIVCIDVVGCEHGMHYYAMQYVEGRTLGQMIADLRQPQIEREAAEKGEAPHEFFRFPPACVPGEATIEQLRSAAIPSLSPRKGHATATRKRGGFRGCARGTVGAKSSRPSRTPR